MRGMKRVKEDILLIFSGTADVSRVFLFSFNLNIDLSLKIMLLPMLKGRGLCLMFI